MKIVFWEKLKKNQITKTIFEKIIQKNLKI